MKGMLRWQRICSYTRKTEGVCLLSFTVGHPRYHCLTSVQLASGFVCNWTSSIPLFNFCSVRIQEFVIFQCSVSFGVRARPISCSVIPLKLYTLVFSVFFYFFTADRIHEPDTARNKKKKSCPHRNTATLTFVFLVRLGDRNVKGAFTKKGVNHRR